MDTHTGFFGTVDGMSTMRQWSINDTSDPKRYVASNTRGGSGRVRGISDWTGSFMQYGRFPSVMPGQRFAFRGYTAPDNDTYGGNGTVYSGTALVDSVKMTWDWAGGNPLSFDISFGGSSVLSIADNAAPIFDHTHPDVLTSCDMKIEYAKLVADDLGSGSGSGSGSSSGEGNVDLLLAIWPNIAQATLTLSAANANFVNSSTQCYHGKAPGVIDFTLALTEQATKRRVLGIDKGDDLELKIWVDTENFWHLKWAHVKEFSGIQVDRESGAVIQRNVNLEMNGFDLINHRTGRIVRPGELTPWWPQTA